MKRLRLAAIPIVAVLALLFVSSGSGSALVQQLTLEQLTVQAHSIVVGTVTDITYQPGAAQGDIYTLRHQCEQARKAYLKALGLGLQDQEAARARAMLQQCQNDSP